MTARVQTPERRQVRRTECLAASVGIVLAYHGRHVPAAELREACGVGRDGATVGDAVRVARSHGLLVRAFRKGSVDALAGLAPPFVAYLDHNHAVVVEGVGAEAVWLNDPAVGRGEVSRGAFDARFTGLVLTFEPGLDFERRPERRAPDPLRWTRAERAGTAALAALATGAGALTAGAVAALPDRGVAVGLALAALGLWAASRAVAEAAQSTVALREADVVSRRVLDRPARARLVQADGLNAALLAGAAGPAAVLGALGRTAFWTAAGLGAACAAALGGSLAVAATIGAAVGAACAEPWARSREDRQRRGDPHGPRPPADPRLHVPRRASDAGQERARWLADVRYKTGLARRVSEASAADAPWALGRWGLAAACPVVAIGTGTGALLPVALLGSAAVVWAPALAWTWAPTLAVWDQRRAVLEDAPRPPSAPSPTPHPVLSFEGVGVAASSGAAPLLDGFDLSLASGEVVAVVGPSGGGKSTAAALAGGLLAPTEGTVRLGGLDVDQLADAVRARVVGVVPQRPAVWPGTVRDLVDLGRGLSDDVLRGALDRSGAPGLALDRTVGLDGHTLSRGERATIGLARVEADPPPLVVLDETLDALGDAAGPVLGRLRAEGRGVLVVTHDDGLARQADRAVRLGSLPPGS